MSNLSNTPGGADLPDRFRNVGEQIQAFFDYAEKNPDRAVPFFVNIWETQASLTTRALALQGLGVAAKHYRVKEAFADWDVLKDIAKEVKGKGEVSNDLSRWAAASALEAIGYSQQSLQHLEGGGFTEPLDRIRREIRDRKLTEINRIQRLNSRGEPTAEYERNLEFWIYGPVEELFAGNDHSRNYQGLVKDVIRELHGRGVYLGLISPNLLVQAEALLQAGSIFKESAEIENFLYPFLEDFLHNPNQEISFRINAAEIIHTARDLSRRLKTLSKLLLEETELRNLGVRLLTPYKQELARVEPDADTVLDALVFSYSLDTLQKHELQNLTISQLETEFSSASQDRREILVIFTSDIAASESLARRYGRSASVLKQFLQNEHDEYNDDIENWIHQLSNQKAETSEEQSKIELNQLLLKDCFLAIHDFDLKLYSKLAYLEKCEEWTNTDYNNLNYNQCQKRLSDLTISKNHIVDNLYKNQQKFEVKKIELILLILVFSLVFIKVFIIFIITLSIVIGIIFTIVLSINQKKTKIDKIEQIIRKLNEQWRR